MLFLKRKKDRKPRESNMKNDSMNNLYPYIIRFNCDAVFITTSPTCPCCSQYNEKIYSIGGMIPKYEIMPKFLYQNACPECGTIIKAELNMR